MLVQARSGERIAILPNTVTCNRSPRHFARRLHWESGMYENEGGAVRKSTLNSKIATGCTPSEFAQRQQDQRDQDARSSWDPPSDSKSYRETWNNAVDYIIPGIPLSTVEYREPPAQGILPSGLGPDAEDKQVQHRIAGFDCRKE